jgi:hypothetical protein
MCPHDTIVEPLCNTVHPRRRRRVKKYSVLQKTSPLLLYSLITEFFSWKEITERREGCVQNGFTILFGNL